jgi:hypothetical protein
VDPSAVLDTCPPTIFGYSATWTATPEASSVTQSSSVRPLYKLQPQAVQVVVVS